MKRLFFSWFMGCVTFVTTVFCIAEGYLLFAMFSGGICAMFAWDTRRSLDRLEREVSRG